MNGDDLSKTATIVIDLEKKKGLKRKQPYGNGQFLILFLRI